MSVDVNHHLLPQQQQQQPHNVAPATETIGAPVIGGIAEDATAAATGSEMAIGTGGGIGGNNSGGGGGGHGGRKRKRNGPNKNFNQSKRQKNKQQNIIIFSGGGGAGGAGAATAAGSLSFPNASTTATAATVAAKAAATGGSANNSLAASANNNNCSKSNAENYSGGGGNNNNNNAGGGGGGRNNKNFYHKIHFRHLNGSRSRRLHLFPALSKYFLPEKRPRKEIIIPPTKFLLGGNISDPLNLNSLQDDDVEASPKSSPMMTPPKVEVIIPPNIHDPLHLLDPVDSIEYEKQLTSPMKKMMGAMGMKKNNNNNNNSSSGKSHKKKNRSGRNSFQKGMNSSFPEATVTGGGVGDATNGLVAGGDADGGSSKGEAGLRVKEEISGLGGGGVGGEMRDSLKQELSVDVELPERKRRISESSTQTGGGGGGGGGGNKPPKMRRMDSIVSPVIPQPGAHKRHFSMGPQGAPHRNRQRTHSVQSQDNNEDLQERKNALQEDAVKVETTAAIKEEAKDEANRSSESLTHSVAGSAAVSEAGDGAATAEVGEHVEDQDEKKTAAAGVKTAKKAIKGGNNNNKKKKNSVFQFGNYDRYYGYRNLNGTMDVRLQVFQQNEFLFKDKDILDIGCNVGQLTMAVAKDLSPRSVIGMDVDAKLIQRAKMNLGLFVRVPQNAATATATHVANEQRVAGEEGEAAMEDDGAVAGTSSGTVPTATRAAEGKSTNKRRRRGKGGGGGGGSGDLKKFAEFFPQSFPLCYGLIPDVRPLEVSSTAASSGMGASATASVGASSTSSSMTPTSSALVVPTGPKSTDDADAQQQQQQQKKRDSAAPERRLFPHNIRFYSGNYVLKTEHQLANDERHKYDLILCLSVTKWVHLNYGDHGLKMMFRRVFNQLRPGGKFILEAQNWASYKKKKKLTERIFRNFQQIEFYPSHFHEYLLSPEVGFSHSYPLGIPRHLGKGFRRPIQLYVKGDYTPSQVMWSEAHHPPQTPYTPYRGIYAEMMCPPPRYTANSSVWGGGDNTPFRPMASTSPYYNPMNTDSYLPSYETEVSNRRYCFQSPLYSAEWSPPPLSSSNSETRTPPKYSTWSVSTTPVTPSRTMQGGGSVTNTPHHRHVYPPDEPLMDLENTDSTEEHPSAQSHGAGVSSSGDTPRTEEDSPEH